eukprot:SAG31_NODE_1915_length_6931_cov_6.219555_5_plen_826_part_00
MACVRPALSSTIQPARKRGRPPGTKSGPRAVSVLMAGGRGGQKHTATNDPNAWTMEDAEDTSDEEWQPVDECLPGLVSDDSSTDEEWAGSGEEEAADEDEEAEEEEEAAHDLSSLLYGAGGMQPQGYRLVDIAQLDQWLQQNACCPKHAEQRAAELLEEFVSFCTEDRREVTHNARIKEKHAQFWRRTNPTQDTATKRPRIIPRLRIAGETVAGWSSTLKIECLGRRPHKIPDLETCAPAAGNSVNDIGLRMAAAFMNMGRGANEWLWFAGMLNIPLASTYKRQFKSAERTVGKVAEPLAESTCSDVCRKAAELSKEQGNALALLYGKEIWPVVCGLDGAWPKRSSGNRYDSNGGVVTGTFQRPLQPAASDYAEQLMQQLDGKIMSFSVLQKHCYQCRRVRTQMRKAEPVRYKEEEPEPPAAAVKRHAAKSCHENHAGSSKSMEWHGAIMLANKMIKNGVYIHTMCSDDDSTMKTHLANDLPEPVRTVNFLADRSHRTKTFAKPYYKLVDKKIAGEEEGHSRVSKAVANKVKQYHGLVAVQRGQNADMALSECVRVSEFRGHMLSMIYHLFDIHDHPDYPCGKYFTCRTCEARQNGSNYIPNISHKCCALKGGKLVNSGDPERKFLHGEALLAKFLKIANENLSDEKIRQSFHRASTQVNEGINRKYWSKAPKDRDFSGSSSLFHRVCLTVCEQNLGLFEAQDRIMFQLTRDGLGIFGKVALRRMAGANARSAERKKRREYKAARKHGQAMSAKEALAAGTDDNYQPGAHQLPVTNYQAAAQINQAAPARTKTSAPTCPFCGLLGHKTRRAKACLQHTARTTSSQ